MATHSQRIAKPYDPTPDERAAREAVRARRVKAPRVKAAKTDAGVELSLDHPDQVHGQSLLMRAMATGEVDFFGELLSQLGRASANGSHAREQRLNFMVAVIKGIEPKDQLETMLAAQMAAVHSLTMDFASRLANADNLVQRDSAERTLNKLARTFAAQVEALKRYRSNGEQKFTVEHISVNEGGKAIVGNVTQGGPLKKRDDPMNKRRVYPYQKSPRCSATSKRTRKPCKAPAVKGWTVCRFHGARGGGPKGKRHGMYRHGLFTKEAVAERRMLRELLRQCRARTSL